MELSNLFDDIKSGKFNLIFYFVCILFFIYIYNKISLCCKISENMADTSDAQIADAVKKYYLSDEFIKNISLVASQLQQNGLKVPGNLEVSGSFNLLPRGTIVAFNSNTAPAGWALCNGANGTPDLRGRFIRMASADLQQEDGATGGFGGYVVGRKSKSGSIDGSLIGNSRTDSSSWIYKMNVGDYGGTDHQVLNVNEIPAHSHRVNDWASHDSGNSWHGNVYHRGSWYTREQNQNGGPEDYNALFDSDSSGAGSSWGHNNMPPYYVLVYIMKL
jgi:microcystin-dependent protein